MKKTQKVLTLILAVALLLAMGATAMAATITINNAENGVKYTLYKLFDATENNGGYTYSLMSGKTNLVAGAYTGESWFEIYDTNKVKAKMDGDNPVLTSAVMNSDGFKNWAKAYGVAATPKTGTGSAVVFDNMATGYYFMETDRPNDENDTAALITVDTVTGDIAIQDKNDPIGWQGPGKSINGTEVVNAVTLDANIPFDISINAAQYKGEDVVYAYVVTDELDAGLTYTSGVAVKYGTTGIDPNGTDAPNGYYIYYYDKPYGDSTKQEITGTDAWKTARSFKLVIPWTQGMDYTKAPVYPTPTTGVLNVTYTAKLDSTKVNPDDLAGKKFENKAVFEPKHDKPQTPPPPPVIDLTPTGRFPEMKTETYTTELEIIKQDGEFNALAGAEFTLTGVSETVSIVTKDVYTESASGTYWKLKDGSYTTEDPTTPNMDQTKYDDINKKYAKETVTETVGSGKQETTVKGTVGSDGKLRFTGLGVGTYTLTESVVPDGYNKAADLTFKVTFKNKRFDTDNGKVSVNTAGTKLSTTVINETGVELPQTGGIGTTIFYAVGSVLLLGAAVLLVTRRRMKTEK